MAPAYSTRRFRGMARLYAQLALHVRHKTPQTLGGPVFTLLNHSA